MFRFRIFTKKRGERRTSSDLGGRIALILFFAVIMIAGGAVLAGVLRRMTIQEWRAKHEFVATEAVIVNERVDQVDEGGRLRFRPEFVVRYSVGGKEYQESAFDASRVYFTDEEQALSELAKFTKGEKYPAWYDPHHPETVVLTRGYNWYAWVVPLLPAAFVAVGFGGLVYLFLTWGKSLEHRSLLQQTNFDLFDPQRSIAARYPTVPADDDVRISPGTTLRYRMPSVPEYTSLLSAALAVVWNLTVAWFVVQSIRGFIEGRREDYIYSPLLLPFVVAGGYLAYLALRQSLSSWAIEPTIVEVSDHPLFPGGTYDLYVAQNGRYQFNRLFVRLTCDEEATFQQGTNSRTHAQRVVERDLLRRGPFTIDRESPLGERIEFEVPNGVMHSFQSGHNAVKWKIVVEGDLHKWPNFRREFTVVMCPGENGGPPL